MTDLNDRMNQKSEELKKKDEEEIASREDRLLTAATVTRGALFDAYETVKLDDADSVNGTIGKFEQCTALLTGQAPAPRPTPAPAPAAQTQPTSSLPFDFDSLSDSVQRMMIMIAQEPSRFREETIGDQVVLKDTRYASARAALRRQQEAERAEEGESNGSSGASDSPAPAKKAVPKPPRSRPTTREATPPAPAAEAPAPAPEPTPAPDAEALAPTPQPSSGDETSESQSQPKASFVDRARDAAKSGAAKLVERNPQ